MSDRFRFRVWDTKDKEYLDPDYYEVFCLLPDGSPHVGMTIYNGICDEYQAIPPKQLIVEQCTGLRDKNGNLIYEGDIVLYGESENEIIWHEAWGGFARVSCAKKRLGLKLDYWELFDHESTKFEIIGNVHEMEVKDE